MCSMIDVKCRVCNKAYMSEYVVCIICKYWFHLKCCDVSYSEMLFLSEGNMPYFCTSCQHVGQQSKNLHNSIFSLYRHLQEEVKMRTL